MIRKKRKEEQREAENTSVALSCGLELLTEVLGLINLPFLFLGGKEMEGWIFVSALVVSKLVQFVLISSFENGGLLAFFEVLSGGRILTDAHQINIHGFDTRVNGSRVAIGHLAFLRRSASGLLQSTPQIIVTLYIMFTVLEDHSGIIRGLFWIQLIFVGVTCLSLGVSLGKINEVNTSGVRYIKSLITLCMRFIAVFK